MEITHDVPTGMKIILVSRNEPDIRSVLERESIVVDIINDDLRDDLGKFVKQSVEGSEALSQKLAGRVAIVNHIVSSLTSAANGMFLLPKYMVSDLETKSTLDEIYGFLEDLPTGWILTI